MSEEHIITDWDVALFAKDVAQRLIDLKLTDAEVDKIYDNLRTQYYNLAQLVIKNDRQ